MIEVIKTPHTAMFGALTSLGQQDQQGYSRERDNQLEKEQYEE